MADVWVRIDKGLHKSKCEDAVLVGDRIFEPGFFHMEDLEFPCVFAVADGLGGHSGSNVASYFVIRRFTEMYRPDLTLEDLISIMVNIDSELIDFSSFLRGKEEMASTLTVLVVEPHRALSAHVGNTRLWEVRNGAIRQLTHDQTAKQIYLDTGNYTKAQDFGNAELMGFMGGGSVDGIAYLKVAELWTEGDRPDQVILTSDGIHDYVTADRFANLYDSNKMYPRRLFQFMFNEAEKNESDDDKSMVLIRF